MDRNRETRRGSMVATNGLSRRRQRSSALRDSPVEDGVVEYQETARLRDRASKEDRDRSSRSKRRRGDRLMHGSNREEGGEESTEESVDDDEEDEEEESGAVSMLPPNSASSALLPNPHQRKSFPPAKVVRAVPWKVSDEMGFSVPKKARSASAKRSHECWISGGGEQVHRQASTSPAKSSFAAPSPAPASPSSSNVSVRKKMRPIGPKHRPPKFSKPTSSVQEDIEIEVAEVLYGLMRQTQCSSKQEFIGNPSQRLDSKDTNGSGNDAKSRVSSPISISPPSATNLSMLPTSSSSTAPLPAVAPKRKKPRPVKFEEESPAIFPVRNCSISSVSKIETEQLSKTVGSSPKTDNKSESLVENGGASVDLRSSYVPVISSEQQPESSKLEENNGLDPKLLTEESEVRDGVQTKVIIPTPKKESPPQAKMDVDLEDATTTKAISTASEVDNHREEKFKIDLTAPLKSSPDKDGTVDCVSDFKVVASDVEIGQKMELLINKEEDKQDAGKHGLSENMEVMVEDSKSHPIVSKKSILNLKIDLENDKKDSSTSVGVSTQQLQKQLQQSKATRNEPKLAKAAQSTSLPSPMTLAGWPGSTPSLGYSMGQVRPLQGMLSLDGSAGASTAMQPPQFLLTQPRPKRCSTHYYIARNIYYHQQFARMNPFWPAAAGSTPLYGSKPNNLNVLPPTDPSIIGSQLQGNYPGRNLNSLQDNGVVEATFSGHQGKDKSSVASNFVDTAQRKQLVLQHAPQPAAVGNLLHGPAFIFPLNQQQAAAAAVKSATSVAGAASSTSGSSSSMAAATTTISFNYPNLPADAQYLAILQNSGYPIPIPAPVGATTYRGPHPQAMPFFNGPFYSSHVLHPSQLQQQQQPQQPHSLPVQQGHQNTSTSSGSSSSHKNQQQRMQGGSSNCGGGNSHTLPAAKNRQQKQQPSQQQQNQCVALTHQVRQLEGDQALEDGPSTGDSQISKAHKGLYSQQNFATSLHPKNLASMSPATLAGGSSGNPGEQLQQPSQQNLKGGMGVELIPSQALAMSFASFNGGATSAPGLDFSSMMQNHAIFQSLPEVARHHGYHQIAAAAAAQAAQQKKIHQISEEGKTVCESNNADNPRNALAGKGLPSAGQSLVCSRVDSNDPSVSTNLCNSVIDNSAPILDLFSVSASGNKTSHPNPSPSAATTTTASAIVNTPNSQRQHQQHLVQLQKQQQIQQHQQQQIQQHQQQQIQQQLAAVAAARTKPTTSTDRLPSSSMAAKFSNALSAFPQTLVQGNSPAQSPQWKNSTRTNSPVSSASHTSTTPSKNLPQQQGRNHTQISFVGNAKPGTAPQGQQPPSSNQSASSLIVGSPSTSISKGAGGSPRANSMGNKVGPAPTLSSQQQAKNAPSGSSRKSSPVDGRNAPSILGNSHVNTALSSGTKPLSRQQLPKQPPQQAQFYFSNAYMQTPSPQSTAAPTTASSIGYYQQRRQPEQQQQQQGLPNATTGILSPSLALAGATTSDPAKAVAAAATNMKGGFNPPGIFHGAQFVTQSGGNPHPFMSFPYMHSVPAVQTKPSEQKQPAGNDNLHASWQPEKR